MNTAKIAARILVESGYAHAVETHEDILDGVVSISKYAMPKTPDGGYHGFVVEVEPFADTIEGHRQLNVIEDFIVDKHRDIWHKEVVNNPITTPRYQWRKDRIEWVLSQLPTPED